jgi:hypothetical protein
MPQRWHGLGRRVDKKADRHSADALALVDCGSLSSGRLRSATEIRPPVLPPRSRLSGVAQASRTKRSVLSHRISPPISHSGRTGRLTVLQGQHPRREPSMGVVMVKCPKTGRAISTGIRTDARHFRSAAVFFGRTLCPHCLIKHEWFAGDAWVDEPTATEALE